MKRCRPTRSQRTTRRRHSEYVDYWLGQLPPRDRLVLTLTIVENCTIAETAEQTGWSQSMVKVQAHRARAKLRKLMEETEIP